MWQVLYKCLFLKNQTYNLQDMEAAQVPISRSVDKTTMGHLQNGILLSHKKEENFTL